MLRQTRGKAGTQREESAGVSVARNNRMLPTYSSLNVVQTLAERSHAALFAKKVSDTFYSGRQTTATLMQLIGGRDEKRQSHSSPPSRPIQS